MQTYRSILTLVSVCRLSIACVTDMPAKWSSQLIPLANKSVPACARKNSAIRKNSARGVIRRSEANSTFLKNSFLFQRNTIRKTAGAASR